ncbi:hypothetical protein COV18_04185 [Candidatus Woesearchaeota archaeon CG10_big_fil_rev_8_21_14_0_10_37_12]|nr:MAG: hypothetical protein COV18_04185 [Candidatus Woesearchaeota archaeon CG10_big_fil_rev_8_21_14_0_10_37_12]
MQITLEQVHKDLEGLKKKVDHIVDLLEEPYELADDVQEEIKQSKKRSKEAFVSQEEMRAEFG